MTEMHHKDPRQRLGRRVAKPGMVLIVLLFSLSGCGTCATLIESDPPGADVYINNIRVNRTTPYSCRTRVYPTGEYTIAVKKDGYTTLTPPQTMIVKTSGQDIFWSIFFPPVLIVNIVQNNWKTMWPYKITYQLSPDGYSIGSSERGTADQLYRKYYQQGLDFVRLGRLEDATVSFRQALRYRPSDPDAEKAIRMSEERLRIYPVTKRSDPANTGDENIVAKLQGLKSLHDQGIVSDEEYATKKKELVDRL